MFTTPQQKAKFLANALAKWSKGLQSVSTYAVTVQDMQGAVTTLTTLHLNRAEDGMDRAVKMLKDWVGRCKDATQPDQVKSVAKEIEEYATYWDKKAS